MKHVQINNPKTTEIDWDKPQWVISKRDGVLILTTGGHNLAHFEGTAMPCVEHPTVKFSNYWLKNEFTLFTGTATLEISND